METMNEFWSMNEGSFCCLNDYKRTMAFKKAIENTIKKGDVVVEMGSGSGVLSMFAIDAGASKVYTVELDKVNVQSLRKTFSANGYTGKIKIIEGDATSINLPEEVDVIICEMIATGLIEELQVPAMNNALRYAKKGTRVLLEKYSIDLDLVSSKNTFYKKTFETIRFELPEMRKMKSAALSETLTLRIVDFTQINKKTIIKEKIDVKITQSGTINGIRLKGRTIFADGSFFNSSTSYSFPMILPVAPIEVKKGETLNVSISYDMCKGPSKLKYSLLKL